MATPIHEKSSRKGVMYVYKLDTGNQPAPMKKSGVSKSWGGMLRRSKTYRENEQNRGQMIQEDARKSISVIEEARKLVPTYEKGRNSVSYVGETRKFSVPIYEKARKSISAIEEESKLVPKYEEGKKSISNMGETRKLSVPIYEEARKSVSIIEEARKLVPAYEEGRKSVSNVGETKKLSVPIYEEGRKSVSVMEARKSAAARVEMNVASVAALLQVKVMVTDMPGFMQVHAFRCARQTYDSLETFSAKHMAHNLKKEFDKVYGPAWHCIVGSSFGSFVTHATGCFLYFSIEKFYILVFKTKLQKDLK